MKKLVFVTGVGRGIGQAVALRLAQDGYVVKGCARSTSELENTKKLSQNKIGVTALDVCNVNALEKWISAESADPQVTPWGLITAAGIQGPVGLFTENDFEQWKKTIEVNLFGTALAAKIFAKTIMDKKLPGRMIFFSGGGSTKSRPRFTSYACSKTAVVRLAETLADELKAFNITVNSIAPGAINTAMTEEILKAGADKLGPEGYQEVLKQKQSGGGSMDKPTALCSYLMGEETSKVSGRLIAAVWDKWEAFHTREDLDKGDIYTLRRVDS